MAGKIDIFVFPAYAGMFPAGGSMKIFLVSVFPAYAGMFRVCVKGFQKPTCFPRVCGDVPWR